VESVKYLTSIVFHHAVGGKGAATSENILENESRRPHFYLKASGGGKRRHRTDFSSRSLNATLMRFNVVVRGSNYLPAVYNAYDVSLVLAGLLRSPLPLLPLFINDMDMTFAWLAV